MSITIVSTVIIGCDVTDKLYRDVEVAGCLHNASGKFCSECGKPSKRVESHPIPGYDGDEILRGPAAALHVVVSDAGYER